MLESIPLSHRNQVHLKFEGMQTQLSWKVPYSLLTLFTTNELFLSECLRTKHLAFILDEGVLSKHKQEGFPGCPEVKTLPSNTWGAGLIPGGEVKIPHALWPRNQTIKQKQCYNKFHKDFKNGPHQKKFLEK